MGTATARTGRRGLRWRDWPLGLKLAALIVTVSVVPVAAVAALDVRAARDRVFAEQAELLAARADQLTDNLDQFHRGYQRAASRLARIPEIVAELDPQAAPGARDLRLAARLEIHLGGDPAVRGIGLIDPRGIVIAGTEPELIGATRAHRGYVRDGLRGTTVISTPYIAASGEPTIAYVAPVSGATGVVVGLVVFWIRAEALWQVARAADGLAGLDSAAVIYDQDGIRIAHTSSREAVFHPAGPLAPDLVARLVEEGRYGPDTRRLLEDVRPFPEQFERARALEPDRALFRGYTPVMRRVCYGVGRRFRTVPWTVFFTVPETTLAAPVASLTRWMILAGLIVGALAIGVGAAAAAMIVRPVRRLERAAAAFAAGDLTARAGEGRGDELGAVGAAFDAMAERLQASAAAQQRAHGELEGLVAQRTAELAAREQSLATTLDSIGDAVIVADARGTIERMNPVAEALTGWSLLDAAGRPLREVFHIVDEDTRAPVDSPVERVLREGRVVELADHTVLISRTGIEHPIADSAAPIVGRDTAIRGVVLVFRDTAAEQAQRRALVASERKYRELYESSPDLYMTAALPSGLIVDVNETLCARLGYTKPELLGRPYHAVYPAELDVAGHRAVFDEAGSIVDAECRLRCKDGAALEASLTLRVVHDDDGRPIAARAIWRDITKRKQIDADRQFLVELGEGLRGATDVPAVFAEISARLGRYLDVARCAVVEVDHAADRVTLGPDHHVGVPAIAGTYPLSSFAQATIEAQQRGETLSIDDLAIDPRTAASFDATYRPLGLGAVVTAPMLRDGVWVGSLFIGAAQPRAWEAREIALVRLVTERVWLWAEHLRVLAALREAAVAAAVRHTEERFRALVESVRDHAIYLLDPDGRIATWNAGAARLFGYSAEEVIGRDAAVLAAGATAASESAHLRQLLDRAAATGRCEDEGWRARRDATRFWANVILTPVHDRDGKLEGFAEVTRDFSEHRRHEEELQAKQAELVRGLREREVLLQEVHHRVKNNFQVISSLINLQARRLPEGAPRAALEECQHRILAIALIHEKLYQSKDYARVRFAEYVRSLAASVMSATRRSPHHVALELAIDEVPIGVDRAIPCGLVINELITNSLRHAFPDDKTGTIRVELRALPEARLQLSVWDDGIGMPTGFDIRVVRTTGLQLVATLAEQLGAELVVGADRGTLFQLTFAQS